MRREGRVRGKPTSKSRVTGRCRSGKTRCRSCRDHPVEKSRAKRMGRYKRLADDVHTNPALADFTLQPPPRHLPLHHCLDLEERLWAADDLDLGGDQSYGGEVCAFCELGCGVEDSKSTRTEGTGIGAVELALQLSVLALSDGSWSEVELTESDEESSDWSVVDVDELDGARV